MELSAARTLIPVLLRVIVRIQHLLAFGASEKDVKLAKNINPCYTPLRHICRRFVCKTREEFCNLGRWKPVSLRRSLDAWRNSLSEVKADDISHLHASAEQHILYAPSLVSRVNCEDVDRHGRRSCDIDATKEARLKGKGTSDEHPTRPSNRVSGVLRLLAHAVKRISTLSNNTQLAVMVVSW